MKDMYYTKDGKSVRGKKAEGELNGVGVRVFDGSNEQKKEFLLKVINGEIKDSYNMEIPANVKLKALSMYMEIEEKESSSEYKGSNIVINIGNEGKSFSDEELGGNEDGVR